MLVRSDIPVLPMVEPIEHATSLLEVQKQTIKLQNFNMDILNVYNPNGQARYEEFQHYFDQLDRKCLIVGNFNAHHPAWSLPGVQVNLAGRSLALVLERYQNICLATQPGAVTYIHPATGRTSVLDLCFCTADLLPDIITSQGPCLGSDHYPIEVTLNTAPFLQPIKTRQRYKTKNVDWAAWTAGLPEISWEDGFQLDNANANLITQLCNSSHEIEKSSGIYNPRFNKSWWTPDCARVVAMRRKAKNVFRRHPTEYNFRRLRATENNAKNVIKDAKKHSWQQFASTITASTSTSQIWAQVGKLRNKYKRAITVIDREGSIYTDPYAKAEQFADYFEEKFNAGHNNPNHNDMILNNLMSVIDDTFKPYNVLFTMDELVRSIKKLKNTSPGG
jgi:hypothetical protein